MEIFIFMLQRYMYNLLINIELKKNGRKFIFAFNISLHTNKKYNDIFANFSQMISFLG